MNFLDYNYISFTSPKEGILIAEFLQSHNYSVLKVSFDKKTYIEGWHSYIRLGTKHKYNYSRFRGHYDKGTTVLGFNFTKKRKTIKIMQHKIGDIVYCKRNFYPSLSHRLFRKNKVFQKGCYYEILGKYDSPILHKFIFRLIEHPIKSAQPNKFVMESDMKIFGTLKDERREKLLKLKRI